MKRDDVVQRALDSAGRGCKYKLGAGGRLWHKSTPWNPITRECDCSGFAAYSLGVDRHTNHPWYVSFNGGWLETTAIVRDARTAAFGMFTELPWVDAVPSDFLVWGDAGGKQGHVGVIVSVNPKGPMLVAHCSTGNWRRTGDAIRVTDAAIFAANAAVVARCALVEL